MKRKNMTFPLVFLTVGLLGQQIGMVSLIVYRSNSLLSLTTTWTNICSSVIPCNICIHHILWIMQEVEQCAEPVSALRTDTSLYISVRSGNVRPRRYIPLYLYKTAHWACSRYSTQQELEAYGLILSNFQIQHPLWLIYRYSSYFHHNV